jgi:hypothetical protein
MGSIEEGVVTITKPNYPKRDGDHWSIDFVETVCRYEYISGREIV